MRTCSALVLAAFATLLVPHHAAAQSTARDRAMPLYRLGVEHMRAEAWAEAENQFQSAITADREFEMAHYMLGRALMPQRKYVESIAAFTAARDLYIAAAGRQFSNAQEMQRYWRDQIVALDEVLRSLQSGPQSMRTQDQIRQVNDRKRLIMDNMQRGSSFSVNVAVPAFVSLSLGSAYFRAGKLGDAEREYKAAIASDPKAGEAHNNLAVVYMESGRLDEAEKAVTAAEKAGFKVHPQLKKDIKDRKSVGQ